jgi:hypothetical protein
MQTARHWTFASDYDPLDGFIAAAKPDVHCTALLNTPPIAK